MGQYFYVINLDKREYLHPHRFGDGLKLLEFGASRGGTMTALAYLLRQSSDGGRGDTQQDDDIIGSWAGDRIAIIGDYDDSGLYDVADKKYEELSHKLLPLMRKDRVI